MTRQIMFRQGDLLLVRTMAMPEGEALQAEGGRLILARGEVTGHHHSESVADAEAISTAEAVYLRIMTPTPLEHQEHAPLPLEPGIYRVIRQREYQPRELPRQVAD